MKREWTKEDQALWDCLSVCLRAFLQLKWLSEKEHYDIMEILDKAINNKEV